MDWEPPPRFPMGDEESDTSHGSGDGPQASTESLAAEYRSLSDDRLIACYRRNSKLLRRAGVDYRTIRVLCVVEECLRAQGIDPYDVIEGLDP